jgi:hypothetical protein
MSNFHISRQGLKTFTRRAALLFALSLSIATIAGAAPQKAVPITKVAVHRGRISPPHAGVKLLEDILSRMRNLPQIAMTYNQQSFKYAPAGNKPEPSQGATDQLLAIRPKENATKAKAESKRRSTLAMAQPAEASYGGRARFQEVESSAKGFASTAQPAKKQSTYSKERNSGLPSTGAGPDANKMMGKMIARSQASAGSDSSVYVTNYGNIKESADRPMPAGVKPLSQTIAPLFDITKKMEDAQRIAQAPRQQAAPGGGGGSTNANVRGTFVADERHSGGTFRNEKQKVISTNPLITEYDKYGASGAAGADSFAEEGSLTDSKNSPANRRDAGAPSIANAPPPAAMQSAEPASPMKPPGEPSLFKHVREFLNRDAERAAMLAGQRQQAEFAPQQEKSKPIEIALLPPSVVTGIPLVRLGGSENETNKALSGKGSLNKTQINDWSVWSLQKPGNTEVSLQVYTRNGQVEAMRIFDTSFISADFGVKLGDDLGTVKQKFGEPAFILSEPQSRGGQNYVYPISQVSFQLAYTSRTTPPKVVSLLIFNAK